MPWWRSDVDIGQWFVLGIIVALLADEAYRRVRPRRGELLMTGVMFRCEVTPDDGEPYEVSAHSRDVLVWEKSGKGRSFGDFTPERLTMTNVYGLCYVAARRQGQFSGTLQEFENSVDVTPLDSDDDESDPTHAGASPAPSSSLPSPPASQPSSGRKRATEAS